MFIYPPCVCMYMSMWVWVRVCHSIYVGIRASLWMSITAFHLEMWALDVCCPVFKIDGLLASNSLTSTSHFWVLGLQTCTGVSNLTWILRNLKSGPHTCITRTFFPKDLATQQSFVFLRKTGIHSAYKISCLRMSSNSCVHLREQREGYV